MGIEPGAIVIDRVRRGRVVSVQQLPEIRRTPLVEGWRSRGLATDWERGRMRPLPEPGRDLDRRIVIRVPPQPYVHVDRIDLPKRER